ncbi:pyocin activator PrtN family protein [Pokkaliibacter sp. MBI-7]|uniref:pyocin activator PrtN family protein n=1 Tax=Pokkaliibacter sp. MBI-7 TaxID=3040600 RepID=UPI00244A00FF|nr:pyocin activator PrtN family protein [Pokkaliibacter sp. MBI-7]MDH2435641.1 pyocin activator PrtN family protein [Pokkaliibacter sp. MBI-7]
MHNDQPTLRLPLAPRADTVELLFRSLGDVLVSAEVIRERYFRNLNASTFREAISKGQIPLPVTTLYDSRKAPMFIDIRHFAAFIDAQAYAADEAQGQSQAQRIVASKDEEGSQ